MLLKSEYSFDINKAKQITTLGGKKKLRKKIIWNEYSIR